MATKISNPLRYATDQLLRRREPSTPPKLTDLPIGGLDDWLAVNRSYGLSWRLIARLLEKDTDGIIIVSEKTVQAWSDSNGAPS